MTQAAACLKCENLGFPMNRAAKLKKEVIPMPSEIIVAILALCGTLIGSIAGIMTANKLVIYRIEQLEQTVAKHNTVIERVALLEQDEKAQWRRIDELRDDMESIKKEVLK